MLQAVDLTYFYSQSSPSQHSSSSSNSKNYCKLSKELCDAQSKTSESIPASDVFKDSLLAKLLLFLFQRHGPASVWLPVTCPSIWWLLGEEVVGCLWKVEGKSQFLVVVICLVEHPKDSLLYRNIFKLKIVKEPRRDYVHASGLLDITSRFLLPWYVHDGWDTAPDKYCTCLVSRDMLVDDQCVHLRE